MGVRNVGTSARGGARLLMSEIDAARRIIRDVCRRAAPTIWRGTAVCVHRIHAPAGGWPTRGTRPSGTVRVAEQADALSSASGPPAAAATHVSPSTTQPPRPCGLALAALRPHAALQPASRARRARAASHSLACASEASRAATHLRSLRARVLHAARRRALAPSFSLRSQADSLAWLPA